MPIYPIRDLGQTGIIRDVSPFDLPINGWSNGRNVRFDDGRVRRGLILRHLTDVSGMPVSKPVFTFPLISETSFDQVGIVGNDLSIYTYANNTTTDRSPTDSGFTLGAADLNLTHSILANVTYLNRPDKLPLYYAPSSTTFEPLPNWDSSDRCKAFRTYKDFAIALNVTKGATDYPTMVKWSDVTQANQVPPSWDETDTTTSAGENVLVDMTGSIIDGGALRNEFIIYGSQETYLMEFVGAPFIFSFRRLFSDDGVINQNCYVEVGGKHYVFGTKDIYVHDGVQKQSIADGRVRSAIYASLNKKKANRCFVAHNENYNEIEFCYVSTEDEVAFPNTDYANVAAVYNYVTNNWTFYDRPNVTASTEANVETVLTYDTAGSLTYETIGGTFASQQDSYVRHMIYASVEDSSVGINADRILVVDKADRGQVAKPLDADSTTQPFVERQGLDLDQLGYDLKGRKMVRNLFPQAALETSQADLSFSFGSTEFPTEPVRYDPPVSFDPNSEYKVDLRGTGRFLSLYITMNPNHDTEISGFDADILPISRR